MFTALAWLYSKFNGKEDPHKEYSFVEKGEENTTEYKMFILFKKKPISPFHDIPLYCDNTQEGLADPLFNVIIEIPRWTNAKMEIDKSFLLNPIKQDIKKGALRFVDNIFPSKGYPWNYGAFPQTWEDPNSRDQHTGFAGDNDPLDICEIGSRILPRGSVVRVKILGIIALIDEGETDWKILVINEEDPLASKMNDIEDIEQHMPGYLTEMREWFRNYKIPQDKPPNEFAFGGEYKNKKFALEVIGRCHEHWRCLINSTKEPEGISLRNVTIKSSPHCMDSANLKSHLQALPSFKVSNSADLSMIHHQEKWSFIK